MPQNSNDTKIDFIGIGAPKSGSTWLAKILEEHPKVLFSSEKTRKEIFFFNSRDVLGDDRAGKLYYYNRGVDWYLNQFPEAKANYIRGEFSPVYMSDPLAYKRIQQYFPDVKIIATLRNPVDVIYSLHWYFYNGAIHNTPKDFSETLKKGLFINMGFYYRHLRKYYDTFPHENIHIILFEDIKRDPAHVARNLYKFLGIDSDFIPPSINRRINEAFTVKSVLLKNLAYKTFDLIYRAKLEGLRMRILESQKSLDIYSFINKKPAKYAPMDSETRKKCMDMYKEDIESLEKLINRDLSAWKKP